MQQTRPNRENREYHISNFQQNTHLCLSIKLTLKKYVMKKKQLQVVSDKT